MLKEQMQGSACDFLYYISSHIKNLIASDDLKINKDLLYTLIFNCSYSVVHFSGKKNGYTKDINLKNNLNLTIDWKSLSELFGQLYSIEYKKNSELIEKIIPQETSALIIQMGEGENYISTAKIAEKILSNEEVQPFIITRKIYMNLLKHIKIEKKIDELIFNLTIHFCNYINSHLNLFYASSEKKYPITTNEDIANYLKEIIKSFILFDHIFNLCSIKIVTTLNPLSRVEGGVMMALIKNKNQKKIFSWFFPHGLIQKSQYLLRGKFDYISPLTYDTSWLKLKAKPYFIPWAETALLPEIQLPIKTNKKIDILWLSQLEGEKIHNIQSFQTLTYRSINLLLANPSINQIIIRARDRNEAEIYKNKYWDIEKIKYSHVGQSSILEDLSSVNCIASICSTGLLYGQHFNLPMIQCVDNIIFDHWPYLLTKKNRRLEINYTRQDCIKLNQILEDIKINPFNTKKIYNTFFSKKKFINF